MSREFKFFFRLDFFDDLASGSLPIKTYDRSDHHRRSVVERKTLSFIPSAGRKASRENKQKLCSRETYAEVRLSRANARPYVYAKVLSKRRLSHRPFPEDIGIYIR